MRWRVLALISLVVNVALATWLLEHRHSVSRPEGVENDAGTYNGPPGRPRIYVRGRTLTWRDIEAADYPTYIANLRDIGCPEQTVRDIIIADVNGLFSLRRATNIVTAQQQWWRSEPDSNVVAAAEAALRGLEVERRTLLTSLLGPNWEAGDLLSLPRPSRQPLLLDGPILGLLPTETRQALEQLSLRSEDRLEAYLYARERAGKDPDPIEVAKLRQQTREELQKMLAPAQLEEYLLRYSKNATDLRNLFGELRFFSPSPDEFRAVFRATDTLDEQIALLGDGTDPNTAQARKALEAQRENAIKLALGAKRYEEYRNLQDPLYRDAVAAAQDAGTPDAARTIYQVNLAALSEQDRIRNDTNLTADQKAIELKRLELQQLQANTAAAGKDLAPDPPMPTPSPPRRTYTLGRGDSAAVISSIYGVPISALQAANPNVNLNNLRPGDSITIPRVTTPPPPPGPPFR
jgi:hypothetical protein